MPVLEKELSEALVHYRYEHSQGTQTVPAEKARNLLRKFHDREHEVDPSDPILATIGYLQAEATRVEDYPLHKHIDAMQTWLDREMRRRWAEERQHLEGTDEFNRQHEAAVGA